MEQYTEKEYKTKFGDKMWQEKVLDGCEGYNIESVWATDSGKIFMIMTN